MKQTQRRTASAAARHTAHRCAPGSKRILPFRDFPPLSLRLGRTSFYALADPPFSIENLPSIWELDAKVDWVVQGLIPERAITLLTGEAGHGKSWLALALAGNVAHGQPFLGLPTVQRDALIVDRENSLAIYRERMDVLRVTKTPRLHVWGMWNEKEPDGPDSAYLVHFAKEHECPLIVFDSLIAFHPGCEQDSAETRRYMHGFRKLAALGATVIVIHHTGKGENTKLYRGSSDIPAAGDMAYLLKKNGSTRDSLAIESLDLIPFRARTGNPQPIKIRFVDGQFVSKGNLSLSIVQDIVRNNPDKSQTEIINLATTTGKLSQQQARAALKKGEDDGVFDMNPGAHNAKRYRVRDSEAQYGASAD